MTEDQEAMPNDRKTRPRTPQSPPCLHGADPARANGSGGASSTGLGECAVSARLTSFRSPVPYGVL